MVLKENLNEYTLDLFPKRLTEAYPHNFSHKQKFGYDIQVFGCFHLNKQSIITSLIALPINLQVFMVALDGSYAWFFWKQQASLPLSLCHCCWCTTPSSQQFFYPPKKSMAEHRAINGDNNFSFLYAPFVQKITQNTLYLLF